MKKNNKPDSSELGTLAQDALSSHILKHGGEIREQQEHMVSLVSEAFTKSNCNAIIQAGTGTGKSLAYLFPALMSGQRTVIATATNQLSEQLYKQDLPIVVNSIKEFNKKDVSYALLKGRNNYACLAKISDLKNLEDSTPMFSDSDYGGYSDDSLSSSKIALAREDSKQVGELITWAEGSDTGDRSDAFPVHERVWKQISVSSSECPGASNCPSGDICFTEIARKKAKVVDVVITNHALLAQEVSSILENPSDAKPSVFGEYRNLIVDEAHDLPDALTGALASELSPRDISKFITKAAQYVRLSDGSDIKLIENARNAVEILEEELEETPKGALSDLPEPLSDALRSLTNFILVIQSTLSKESARAAKRDNATKSIGIEILSNNAIDIATSLTDAMLDNPNRVRWVEKRGDVNPIYILRIAPLEVSEEYSAISNDRNVLLTSATLTVGNSFDPIQRTLGIDIKQENNFSIDVGSPFDYPKQGMLYIPDSSFPEPVGKDRVDHTKAVLAELYDLAHASGGRTLALFTTTKSAQLAAEYLRERISEVNIYAHGEAPADALVRMFREDETSILCATMGLWQGTNVPGPSCSLVVIDKVGFSPIDDVLTNARREMVSRAGRDGFKEIVVAQAATSLAQAAGRLIRSTEDKGVVAILDPRIRSKSYGRTLLASLPDFKMFSDKNIVTDALTRLTGGMKSVGEKPDVPILKAAPTKGLPNAKPKPSANSKLVRSSYKKNIGKSR
jgi:ATP-dependent DNA helicase DinG